MPTLHPDIHTGDPAKIERSERKFLDALVNALPKGWQAWHSLPAMDPLTSENGEGDVVILDPNSGSPRIMVIEVKGGFVRKIDGSWRQNGHETDPFAQVQRYRRILLHQLRNRHGFVADGMIGYAICFPDVVSDTQPSQADAEGLVINGYHFPWLSEYLPQLMDRAVPSPREQGGNWHKRLHELWCEAWLPNLSLRGRIDYDNATRVRLDDRQRFVLDTLELNSRVRVRGAAGSGKSILCQQLVRQRADAGQSVLLMCFTDALANAYTHGLADLQDQVKVCTVRDYARQVIADAGGTINTDDPDFWNAAPENAEELLRGSNLQVDNLILDEYQDLDDNDWILVSTLADQVNSFVAFGDSAQRLQPHQSDLAEGVLEGMCLLDLGSRYRCPPAIQALVDAYSHNDPDLVQVLPDNDDTIKVITSSEARVHRQVEKELNRLYTAGIQPHEIVIISLRGANFAESIIHESKLGNHKLVRATDPDAHNQIICDTFWRFKGLERPVVIVTDLRFVTQGYNSRMHVACSRATSILRIIGKESDVEGDEILGRLR